MKISPISSNITPAAPSEATNIKALKMSTLATPGPANPEAASELSISDSNEEKTNPAAEVTEPISPQFAALARERRALQVKRRELELKEKALETKSQGSDQIPLARLKSEPLSVLLEAGVTYDQLTEAILANQGNSDFNELKAEMAAFKQGVDQKLTDQEVRAEQAALSEMKREAEKIIFSNDDFELVRETKSVPDVLELIKRTYKETGEVLDVTEALKLVEDELFTRNQKIANLKKMQGLFNKQPEPQPMSRPQGMRTLTNKDTASIPMDRRQRALAAWGGTLKR